MDKQAFTEKLSGRLKKINRRIILDILNILIEELIEDIRSGKEIKIHNFISLHLKDGKDGNVINIWTKEIMPFAGRKILKIKFLPEIIQYIKKYLDIKKTFDENP